MDPADCCALSSVRAGSAERSACATVVCLWYLGRLWWKGELPAPASCRVLVLWFVAALGDSVRES